LRFDRESTGGSTGRLIEEGSAIASYTAPPIRSPLLGPGRAELVFAGVEQAGPSFEGRVFLNRADADESTPRTPEMGYAGSYHVYGYGQPVPPGIADAKAQRQGAGPVAPIEKRVLVGEDVVRAALGGSDELTITVVTVPADPGGTAPERPFETVEVVFD
jgi:hypothetical protein